MRVSEGDVEVEAPDPRDGSSEGAGDAVFFNPEMELNRDLTVAVLRAYAERTSAGAANVSRDGTTAGAANVSRGDEERTLSYLDAMTATGVRAARAAEAGYDVTAADVDADAIDLARENLALNDLPGEAVESDANVLMHSERFDVVDLDPFGTPMPFADAAVAGTRKLLCVTATDTAPLCGAHFDSGVRKYDTVPRNTDFHREMGLRVLIGALSRVAARRDVAVEPICSHATRHYARTYLDLTHKATAADKALEWLGFVHHCEDCLYREHEFGRIAHPPEDCPNCGSARCSTAGPIWLGPIADREFVGSVADEVTPNMGEWKRVSRLLDTLAVELDTPTHYDQHRLCKQWGAPANKLETFLDDLRDAGYDASPAHYGGTCFKTDADVAEIRAAAEPSGD
ncbi:tRNA (guanine(26)-N(2))-dimethyltransferase [Halolamina pelagica]|uniref:tRNA (guanine(26)-N(2))-dimethyltransferase n=1 Tax=Halolamina pelagica TaxID=699431 RepID=A0A0N8HZJ2_9EURY|nr:tRNA (guanine(10)-N(2))-dimethyltransferase [Halolamina pelagica]KPN29659.1 tRNA (guanine(26)-N(2))-dimethyltransferase [Halolamina pelagica]